MLWAKSGRRSGPHLLPRQGEPSEQPEELRLLRHEGRRSQEVQMLRTGEVRATGFEEHQVLQWHSLQDALQQLLQTTVGKPDNRRGPRPLSKARATDNTSSPDNNPATNHASANHQAATTSDACQTETSQALWKPRRRSSECCDSSWFARHAKFSFAILQHAVPTTRGSWSSKAAHSRDVVPIPRLWHSRISTRSARCSLPWWLAHTVSRRSKTSSSRSSSAKSAISRSRCSQPANSRSS